MDNQQSGGNESPEERAEQAEQRQDWAEERTEWAEERTQWAEERTDWAEERTGWAQHRTLLANERNFSAWLRTGMSAIAGGIAVAEFLGDEEARLIPRVIGIILIVVGATVCGIALWRYNQISKILEEEGHPVTPKWAVYSLVSGIILAAFLLLIMILYQ
jgi:putative membrane protein